MKGLFAIAVGLLALAVDAPATTLPRKPTTAGLAKVWIGGGSGGSLPLPFLRLELDHVGLGLLTMVEGPREPAVAYRVRGLTLRDYDVEFDLEPLDTMSERVSLKGFATSGHLELSLRGVGWQREVRLMPLGMWEKCFNAVTERAQREAAQAPSADESPTRR